MKDQGRTPLRTILINFLNHIEHLESEKFPEECYDSEFQDLKQFSESLKGLKEYSCFEGEKEVNKKKNRYKDILPFDVSRVILTEYAGIPGSDYINANYIKGASGSIAYIASQGPLPNTVNDFWRMVVQCEVQVIVMACNEEEAGKTKCEKYWVEDREEKHFGMVSVRLLKASTVCPDFSVRTMKLKYTNSHSIVEERTVCQLHYLAWPDHGIPSIVQPLLDMVRLVRDTQASETLPVLIHCSAGCGRTGTICAIDYVWGLLRTGKLTKEFSLFGLVREMRRQRIAMVQTKEQYILVHQAVRELFKEQLNLIDSHPYENIDTNGMIRIKEDPIYDVVDCKFHDDENEEKRDDRKEKEASAPPLPLKHYSCGPISKHEKEVENRSAQRKLLELVDSGSESLTSVSTESMPQPNIEIFNSEREQFSEINKYSLPSRNKDIFTASLGNNITRTKSLVKRSESLKLSLHNEKYNLTSDIELSGHFTPGLQPIRGASSPLNLKKHLDNEVNIVKEESKHPKKNKNVIQLVKDYEALSLSCRRPLGRSYTTLDMRHKVRTNYDSTENPSNNNTQNLNTTPAKERKQILSRSHTQIELRKTRKGIELDESSLNMTGKNSSVAARNCCHFVSENTHSMCSTTSICGDKKEVRSAKATYKLREESSTIAEHQTNHHLLEPSVAISNRGRSLRNKSDWTKAKAKTTLKAPSGPENETSILGFHKSRRRTNNVKASEEKPGNILSTKKYTNGYLSGASSSESDRCDLTVVPRYEENRHLQNGIDFSSSWRKEAEKFPCGSISDFEKSHNEPIYSNVTYEEEIENESNKKNSVIIEKNLKKLISQLPMKSYRNGYVTSTQNLQGTCANNFSSNPKTSKNSPCDSIVPFDLMESKIVCPKTNRNRGSEHTHFNKPLLLGEPKLVYESGNSMKPNKKEKPQQKFSCMKPPAFKKNFPAAQISASSDHPCSSGSAVEKVEGLLQFRNGKLHEHHPAATHLTTHDVRLRHPSRDDQSLNTTAASGSYKVKRHTSVILQRSFITEPSHWTRLAGREHHYHNSAASGSLDNTEHWDSAPGVDIDEVAASISQKDGKRHKLMKAALEALHNRKSKQSGDSSDLSTSGAVAFDHSKKQEYI